MRSDELSFSLLKMRARVYTASVDQLTRLHGNSSLPQGPAVRRSLSAECSAANEVIMTWSAY